MFYYLLFGLIISMFIFGFRRTMFLSFFLFMGMLVLLFLGTAFVTLLPVIVGLYIFYIIFGKKYYQKKYKEQSENFEKTFRFYYYNTGDNRYGENNGQKYNDYINNYDVRKYYSLLGVNENSSEEEVKTAYKKLAKQYHPDLHASESIEEQKTYENKFKEINEAYEEIKKRQL